MTAVERKAEDFVIDATLLAEAFGLSQDEIKARMRNGAITSRCEACVDEDAGLWRFTFHRGDRACRFIVDEADILEDGQPLVECLSDDGGACTLDGRCRLKARLRSAEAAFLAELNRTPIADIALAPPKTARS
jgi:hypothetical protein